MKIIGTLCLLAALVLLGGCSKEETFLNATLVAKERSAFQVEMPSGERVVCRYELQDVDSSTPPYNAKPGDSITLSTYRLGDCIDWQGPVTGKVVGARHTHWIDGVQYISAFVLQKPNGKEFSCPVDVAQEKILKRGDTEGFGDTTREGCYPI